MQDSVYYKKRSMSEQKETPTPFQKKICWMALCALSLLFIIILVAGALYLITRCFIAVEAVLLPVVIAGCIAYLLNPLVNWVQKHVQRRILAVLAVMLCTGLVMTGLGMMIVPPLVQQTGELIKNRHALVASGLNTGTEMLDNSPLLQHGVTSLYQSALKEARSSDTPPEEIKMMESAETWGAKLGVVLNHNSSFLFNKAIHYLTAGTQALFGMASFLIGAIMVPVFLFYFLLESESIIKNWHKILPLSSSHFKDEVVATLQQINGYIVSFIRGQMLVSLIDGVLLGICLMILGLPYAITIACAAALLGIIPYIGMISTSIPAMLIAWFTWHDISMVVAVGAIFFSISQFDGWVIQPRIVGNTVGMHDFTVMFSVLFWSIVLGGVIGALLAVPLTASIKVIFMRYIWPDLPADKAQKAQTATPEPPEQAKNTTN